MATVQIFADLQVSQIGIPGSPPCCSASHVASRSRRSPLAQPGREAACQPNPFPRARYTNRDPMEAIRSRSPLLRLARPARLPSTPYPVDG